MNELLPSVALVKLVLLSVAANINCGGAFKYLCFQTGVPLQLFSFEENEKAPRLTGLHMRVSRSLLQLVHFLLGY